MLYSKKGVLGKIVGVHAENSLNKFKHIKLIMSSFFIYARSQSQEITTGNIYMLRISDYFWAKSVYNLSFDYGFHKWRDQEPGMKVTTVNDFF